MYGNDGDEPYLSELTAENARLCEVVRQQGEFIESMREMIRDFVYGPGAAGRSLGRRGPHG